MDVLSWWAVAFRRLEDLNAGPAERADDGSLVVRFTTIDPCAEELAQMLPAPFLLAMYEEIAEDDPWGQHGTTYNSVWLCPEHRGVLVCNDHYKGGLCGALELCPDDASFERAKREAFARFGQELREPITA